MYDELVEDLRWRAGCRLTMDNVEGHTKVEQTVEWKAAERITELLLRIGILEAALTAIATHLGELTCELVALTPREIARIALKSKP